MPITPSDYVCGEKPVEPTLGTDNTLTSQTCVYRIVPTNYPIGNVISALSEILIQEGNVDEKHSAMIPCDRHPVPNTTSTSRRHNTTAPAEDETNVHTLFAPKPSYDLAVRVPTLSVHWIRVDVSRPTPTAK